MQTVFDVDLAALLPANRLYFGYGLIIPLETANGTISRQSIMIEVKLMCRNGTAFSEWILECGVITPVAECATALSGQSIRGKLYFATASGNNVLYVAERKSGITFQLPAL